MNDAHDSRERTIEIVLARIAAAPDLPRQKHGSAASIDVVVWATPALIAASLIIVASAALLVRAPRGSAGPDTVVQSIGISPPLSAFLSDGRVDTWNWLSEPEETR